MRELWEEDTTTLCLEQGGVNNSTFVISTDFSCSKKSKMAAAPLLNITAKNRGTMCSIQNGCSSIIEHNSKK